MKKIIERELENNLDAKKELLEAASESIHCRREFFEAIYRSSNQNHLTHSASGLIRARPQETAHVI